MLNFVLGFITTAALGLIGLLAYLGTAVQPAAITVLAVVAMVGLSALVVRLGIANEVAKIIRRS